MQRTGCGVGSVGGGSFSLRQQGVGLVLLSAAVEHLGLAVGFGAVDHREQSLQRQQVGGVELPRHRERILRNTR